MSRKKAAILIALLLVIAGLVWRLFAPEPAINPTFIDRLAADLVQTHNSQGLIESLVDSLAYDPQNKRLAVGRESGDIEIWDLKTENPKRIIKGAHGRRTSELYFTVDGKGLFSSSSLRDAVKLWDVRTGKLSATVGQGFPGPTISLKGGYYLTAEGGAIHIYDGRQEALDPRAYSLGGPAQSLAVAGQSGLVAVGTASGSVDLFQFSVADQGPSLEKIREISPYENGNGLIALGFSADGQSLYTVAARPGRVDEWSVPGLEKKGARATSGSFVSSAKFSPDKRFLALVGNARKGGQGGDYAVELISLASGKSIIQPVATNFGQVVFIPPLGLLLAVHGYTLTPIPIPEDF